MSFAIKEEQENSKLVEISAKNKKVEADIKAYALNSILAPLAKINPEIIRSLSSMGMDFQLSDNQVLYAVNDFFIGVKNHSSARYALTIDGKTENQSSSGIIVSTQLGRSGWMKSVLTGASCITSTLTKESVALKERGITDWQSNKLTFAVREPFPSISTGTKMGFGSIYSNTKFRIESKMGENGFIFSDGVQEDYLDFNYSVVATVSVAPSKGNVILKF